MDVLFLSVSAGGGHIKAAEAVKEVVERRFPGSRTMIVDTLKYINPILDKLIIGSYLNTIKTTPKIYGMLYEMAETGDNLNDFGKTVNKLLAVRIKKLINEFKPSVIVSTHAFPLQMMSALKRKKRLTIPTISVITDFKLHPFYVHENIDAFVVANEYIRSEFISKGIPSDIVHPLGIPVVSKFLQEKNRSELLRELRLENKRTVLIMGGSLGFGEIKDVFEFLVNWKENIQIVAITGKNIKLKKQLDKYTLNSNKNIKILSYTSKVADYMEISDIIVTKPGGLTIAESLVKELPIIITSPIPGQEERNAQFLLNNGVAARILDNDDVGGIFQQVLNNPLRLRHMKEMAQFLAKPNASEDIVTLMEKMISR